LQKHKDLDSDPKPVGISTIPNNAGLLLHFIIMFQGFTLYHIMVARIVSQIQDFFSSATNPWVRLVVWVAGFRPSWPLMKVKGAKGDGSNHQVSTEIVE
jgi:hypothetical protein